MKMKSGMNTLLSTVADIGDYTLIKINITEEEHELTTGQGRHDHVNGDIYNFVNTRYRLACRDMTNDYKFLFSFPR